MDGALSDQGEVEMGEEEVGCKGLKGRVTEDRWDLKYADRDMIGS